MKLADLTLKDFLDELGSDKATPGGGAVAALTGANAAGLVGMVAHLSLNHSEILEQIANIHEFITMADRLREELRDAIDSDAQAFDSLMAAYKLPEDQEAAKQTRNQAIQSGLKVATESPLSIARSCYELLTIARSLTEVGNKQVVSDAGAAALLAEAALRSALLQARINLRSLKDTEYVTASCNEIDRLEQLAQTNRDAALQTTLAKLDTKPKA